MALLGKAAVAMWWNIAAEHRDEFNDWHSKEHFPERLAIPGFRRGSRWASVEGNGDYFVLYELADYATLTSDGYRERLNNPTPWSQAMMPRHQNMVRSQCHVVASAGAGVASHMLTARLSPIAGQEAELEANMKGLIENLVQQRGVTGAHLLITETPEAAQTNEQKIRGGDAVADWILLVSGYDEAALEARLARISLQEFGAAGEPIIGRYRLVHAMTASDV